MRPGLPTRIDLSARLRSNGQVSHQEGHPCAKKRLDQFIGYGILHRLNADLLLLLSMLVPQLRHREPFALFFAAVAVSARYGGRGSGLLACVLAVFLTDYFVIEPAFTWSLGLEDIVPLLACVVVATIAVSAQTVSLKKPHDRQQENELTLQSMASEASLAEERERRRIATGLHDRLGQTLALSKMRIQTLRDELGRNDEGRRGSSTRHRHAAQTARQRSPLVHVRASPPIPLRIWPRRGCWSGWPTSMNERYGLASSCQNQAKSNGVVKEGEQGHETDIVLFQAVRELLTNVVKHAKAKNATVTVTREEKAVRVKVEDDGVGFDSLAVTPGAAAKNCFGLFNIRERIQFLGGSFALESVPQRGTRVTLEMPVR